VSRYFAFDKTLGEGRWGDIVWRYRPVGLPDSPVKRYIVSVGDRTVGEIWWVTRGWTAISHAQGDDLLGLRSVEGFRTRWAATEYLLNVGVRPARERD
jgi:hypothetical protein